MDSSKLQKLSTILEMESPSFVDWRDIGWSLLRITSSVCPVAPIEQHKARNKMPSRNIELNVFMRFKIYPSKSLVMANRLQIYEKNETYQVLTYVLSGKQSFGHNDYFTIGYFSISSLNNGRGLSS